MINAATPLSVCLGLEKTSESENTFTPDTFRSLAKGLKAVLRRESLNVPAGLGPGLAREAIVALRTPLTNVMVEAWNARAEIRKYADPEQYPSDEAHTVFLAHHTINQTVKPSIEIHVDNVNIGTIVLEAALHVRLDAIALVIRGGRITHLRSGTATLSADLTSGKAKLLKLKSKPLQLPGEFALGQGILIPPRRHAIPEAG